MVSIAGTLRRRPYLPMIIAALAARLAMILITRSYIIPILDSVPPLSFGDPHLSFGFEMGSIAHSIVTGHGFGSPFGPITGPTAWIAPVYPYLCAAVFKIFGLFTPTSAFVLLFLNSIFAALTCIPLYQICDLTMGRATAQWTGWAWALVPYFWLWPTAWIWETSLVALLLAYLVLWTLQLADAAHGDRTNRWLKFGLLWGFAALTSPVQLTFFPVSFGWLAYRRWREKASVLRPVILALVVCALVVTPWLVRNRVVFGQFVFIRSNFGFEFRLGNYHLSQGRGWFGRHPTANKAERDQYARMGEIAYVAAKRDEALEFVRQNPREFLTLTLWRMRLFWSSEMTSDGRERSLPWPWVYGPLSLLAALGLLFAAGDKVRGAGLFLGLLLLFPLPNYIAFAQTRYRHPIEPEMLALSVYCLTVLWREFRGKRREPRNSAPPVEVEEAEEAVATRA